MKKQRWRITFSKTEAMRYTGHLDLILTWERTFRRSGLPLSYSNGYNPRPVINLAAPLPLGYTSTGEIGDFWLSEKVAEPDFRESLVKALPPGLVIQHCQQIEDLYADKLPSLVHSARYSIAIPERYSGISQRIPELLSEKHLLRTRKGKEYDLRPLIEDLTLHPSEGTANQNLQATLLALPGATGRPDELLKELAIPAHETSICREVIILKGSDPE